MKSPAITFSFLTLLIGASISSAQPQPPLQNVARLCTSYIYANSVNGGSGEQDSPFYGGRNAFDDGKNVVNGNTYTAWAPGKQSDWIRLHFAGPVGPLTVEAITVRAEEDGYLPDTMQATIIYGDGKQEQIPVVNMTNPLTSFHLPAPAKNVSAVRLDFQAKQMFQITEIQVMGQPSQYCHTAENTPSFDEDYKNQLVVAARPKINSNGSVQDAQITSALKEMVMLHNQVNSAQGEREKADAWLNLNHKADDLAARMSQIQLISKDPAATTPAARLTQIADKSKGLGIPVSFCEIGDDWTADPVGYENYLRLLPGGPNADEAFWKSKVEPSGCGDFEGSVEEYQQGIARYRDFIERYPSSSYAEKAKSQLAGYEAGVREAQAQQQKTIPTTPHN